MPLLRKISLLSLLTLSLSACNTAPTKFGDYATGSWNMRAMIRDKANHQSYVITADTIAQQPDHLKMDVTTPIGIYLGSFVLNKDKVSYYLASEKKLTTVPATAKSMRPLIQSEMDPYLIVKILFDVEPGGKDWKCKKNARGFLESCEDKKNNMSLRWLVRQMGVRKIEFQSSLAQIQMSLKGFQSKVEIGPETFQIKPKQ